MRSGAIFARGSCRALKWMALFGVVFALGADSASAQVVKTAPSGTKLEVTEGETLTISYEIRVRAAVGFGGGTLAVATRYSGEGGTTDPRTGEPTISESGMDIAGVVGPSHEVAAVAGGATAPVDHTFRGRLVVLALSDPDAEDEIGKFEIAITNTGNVTGRDGTTVIADTEVAKVTIRDRQTQTFEWIAGSLTPAKPIEGAPVTVAVRAEPAANNYEWSVNARSDSNQYPITPAFANAFTIPGTIAGQTVGITAPSSDGEREDTTVTMTLYYAGTNEQLPGIEPYEFTFADIHKLPAADKVEWKAYADNNGNPSRTEVTSITEGGGPVHVTVTVDRGTDGYPSGEMLEVTPMAASSQGLDFRMEGSPLEIASGTGKKSDTFKVWALADDDIGDENLVFDLMVKGKTATNGTAEVMAAKSVSLEIMDETVALLTTKSDEDVMEAVAAARMEAAGADEEWTPGESFSLREDALFNMVSGNPIQLAATSSSESVSVSTTGDTVTLTAMSVGMATITITGTVTGSSAVMQTRANVASVEFDVMVDELDLEIELTGPADMNIAEGMSATVTATANRAVTADTMVELVGTGGSASPADWSAEPIMIMAGEMTGTTDLMATEDNMEESMEMLTIEGRVGTMKTNMLTFNLWDAAVPALPVIAQLLLAAFLAIGGYRRYLRRR